MSMPAFGKLYYMKPPTFSECSPWSCIRLSQTVDGVWYA